MRVSLRWLKEFLEIKEDPFSFAELLTQKGIGVEGIVNYGERIEGFAVAEVVNEEGDKTILSLGKESYKVEKLAGVKLGDKVGFSPSRKGVLSKANLDFGDGIPILDEIFPVGAPLAQFLDDYVYEVEITSNRGDLMSIFGIAREISAFLDQEVKRVEIKPPIEIEPTAESLVKLEIENPRDCPSYLGSVISGVKIAPSPFSLQWRLFVSGIRPNYNVVDATNYILLQYGQPLHPFDLDRIFGEKVVVRRAKPKERIKTIDNLKRELSPEVLVIADSFRPIAIAGVMGGSNSEIVANTKKVFLECAGFAPSVIRKGSLSLRLRTEASRRFEMGIDESFLKEASLMATSLIAQLSGGKVHQGTVGKVTEVKRKVIALRPERVGSILGVNLDKGFITNALNRMHFPTTEKEKIEVVVPSYRRDIKEEIDLIEELARFYGYEHLPDDFSLKGKKGGERNFLNSQLEEVATYFANLGFYEVKTVVFTNKETLNQLGFFSFVQISNPLNANFSLLRPSLLPTLLPIISENKRRGNKDLRLFEIGKVYTISEKGRKENYNLAIVLSGSPNPLFWQKGREDYDLFDLKGIFTSLSAFLSLAPFQFCPKPQPFLHLGLAVKIISEKREETIGHLGAINPNILKRWDIDDPVWFGEISLQDLISPRKKFYRAIPPQTSFSRDFAFLLAKKIPAQEVLQLIKEKFADRVTDCELFDYFLGPPLPPDKKNLGIRLTVNLPSRGGAVSEKEAEEIFTRIVETVTAQFGAELRQRK